MVVENPGLLTTVQDLGRPGWAHLGVPAAGAVDPVSLRTANRLVGNAADAAALESTLRGPRLSFTGDAVVAVAGAPCRVLLDGTDLAFGRPHRVAAGQRLVLGSASAGVRSYLAVAGGVQVPAVLGSRSADTLAGLGPAPLRAGDRLPIGLYECTGLEARSACALTGHGFDGPVRLRVTLGPRQEFFTPAAVETFVASAYTVTPAADRVGIRLAGPAITRADPGRELLPEGLVTGAIQVPHDGQPILLLTNHSATGGYPVMAVLALVDLPVAAQLRPGASVRFDVVDPADARALLLAQRSALGS